MYDLNSKFDINQHKTHYVNYLEIIIFPDGHIEYAVPSHQEKLISICCEKFKVTRDQLMKMCPREYYCNFLEWLCTTSGCISVWNTYIQLGTNCKATQEQIKAIEDLKAAHLLRDEDLPEMVKEIIKKITLNKTAKER